MFRSRSLSYSVKHLCLDLVHHKYWKSEYFFKNLLARFLKEHLGLLLDEYLLGKMIDLNLVSLVTIDMVVLLK